MKSKIMLVGLALLVYLFFTLDNSAKYEYKIQVISNFHQDVQMSIIGADGWKAIKINELNSGKIKVIFERIK